jgi:CHAT domain-containing protein/Tfp pilus assembly protein PilF
MRRLRLASVLVPVLLAAAVPQPPKQTGRPANPGQLRAAWAGQREDVWRQIRQLAAAGKYETAVDAAGKLLDLERTLLGAEHELVADSLSRLATVQAAAGDYAAGEKSAARAAELFAKLRGPEDWRSLDARVTARQCARGAELAPAGRFLLVVADRLYADAYALHTRMDHRHALPEYAAALALYRTLLGEDSRPVVELLAALGNVYTELREFDRAERMLEQAGEVCAAVFGPLHPDAGTIHNHRGVLAVYRADYPRAEASFKKALEIHRQTGGGDSDAVAVTLTNLGGLAAELGDFLGAIRTLGEAHAIFRRNHGPQHPDVATVLHKVGQCRMALGDYDLAEQALRQALEIRRRADGEESSGFVHVLNGLGVLYLRIGDRRGADRTLSRTAELARFVLGDRSYEYAATLNNIGSLYAEAGRYPEAESAFRKAVEIKTALLGEKHPDTVLGLHNLGTVLRQAGKVEEAGAVLGRSSALAKEVLGERHPDYPNTRSALAALFLLKGEYARAEELAGEALGGHERVRGPVHPLVADALELRAKAEAATGRPRVALATLDQALRVQDRHLRMVFGFATESAMQSALRKANDTTKLLLSVARTRPAGDPAATDAALTWVLRRKAGVLESLCRHREVLLLTRDDPEVRKEADAVREAFARYQHLASAAPEPGAGEAKHLGAITESRRRYEEAEGRLRRAADHARPPAVAEVDAAAVRRKLPAGSALVEFVRAEPYDFRATGKTPAWQPARYLALVLLPDAASPVRLIDLGDAAEIDERVRELRSAITRAPRGLKTSSEVQLDAEFRELAAGLGRRVFAPLRDALGDARVIYLAPDADLNLLPFEALADAGGRYLIETYRFNYLSSGRDLLRSRAKPGTGTVVFAGPDFDWAPAFVGPLPPADPADAALSAGVTRGVPVRGARGLRWPPLPGAAGEADDLKAVFAGTAFSPVTAHTGADARKSTFRELPAPPRVLHVATHGFFLAPAFADDSPAGAPPDGLPPLLCSGLVLAGANRWAGSLAPPEDDGWLTAEEVGLMNLRGTELVVLSACESGLGEVRSGEGVFGLRRAFLYAGADTLLVSLFKVPDAETRELMRAFYRGVRDGKGKAESLHEAKRAVIAARRAAGGAAHPFFWASFVAIGGAE